MFSTARVEDGQLRYQKALRGATGSCRSPETELMLEGEDDVVGLLQEKDMDNLGGEETLAPPSSSYTESSTFVITAIVFITVIGAFITTSADVTIIHDRHRLYHYPPSSPRPPPAPPC